MIDNLTDNPPAVLPLSKVLNPNLITSRDVFNMGHVTVDSSRKAHNALDIYPTMQYFVKEMCTHVHISVAKLGSVGYGAGTFWRIM